MHCILPLASPSNLRSDAIRSTEMPWWDIRRRADIQLLILCKNPSNSIYLNSGFSQCDMTQTTLSLYFVESYRDEKFHWHAHNSPSRQSPNSVWRIKVMSGLWSNVYAFFLAVFSGMQDILPSFGRLQSSFARKNYAQARCKFSSRTPASWAEWGPPPRHRILPVEQNQIISHPRG